MTDQKPGDAPGEPKDERPPDEGQNGQLPQKRTRYLVLMAIALAIMLVVIFLVQKPTNFEDYIRKSGYAGVFLMALIGSASPVWPLPGTWAVFIAAGLGLNPVYLALLDGIGEPCGEMLYFTAGYGGQVVLRRIKMYGTIAAWMKRRGGLTIFLVSAIPNVFIKLATSSAGALNYPAWKVFVAMWGGKTIKGFAFAFAGWGLFNGLKHLLQSIHGWFGGHWVFWVIVGVVVVGLAVLAFVLFRKVRDGGRKASG